MAEMTQEDLKKALTGVMTKLAELDKKLYNDLNSYSYTAYFLKFRNELAEVNGRNEQNLNTKLKQNFAEYMEKPKFKTFPLADRKYKKYIDIFTEDYIAKLMLRKISSNFYTLEDFKNPDKWREFIDRKEKEYQQAIDNEGKTPYEGTFEEFLQENSIITYEFLHDGFSSTKNMEKVYKERQEEAKRVGKANKNAMNFADTLSTEEKKVSPYGFKHGPKGSESYDEVSRRYHR